MRSRTAAVLTVLVLLSCAFAGHELPVRAQAGDAGQAAGDTEDNEDPSQREVPPGCYRDPNLGDIIICPSVSIAANPTTIAPGHSATLNWSSSHTTSRSISHGIGSVGSSGSTSVSPTSSTTYTITGYSPAGSHTDDVRVTVGQLPDPPAPAGLSASPGSETSVNLSWNSRAGITKYWVRDHSDSITGTSYTVRGLRKCTTRIFKVRAYGDGTTYRAKWGPEGLVQGSTVCPDPPAPAGFSASAAGSYTINLSWHGRSGVTIYQVEGQSSSITRTNYTVSGLHPCTRYTYRLRGHGDGATYAQKWGPWVSASATTEGCATVTGRIWADATTIDPGQSTTLSWTTAHATSVSIDQGIGTVGASGSRSVSPSSTTTYTLSASGPGGSITRSVRVTVADGETVTGSLSADPTTIDPGQSTTLSWTTAHATSVSIDQGIGTVGASGSRSVSPSSTTTYTLSASGPGGSITRSVRVTVADGETVTGSLSADPTTIDPGQSTTLSWTTTHATSVSIDQGIGTVGASGSRSVSPSSTTTYTLSASGPGGSITRSVRVTVADGETVTGSLSADPTTIDPGQSTTLSWTTTHATSVSIDQGIGTVTANAEGSRRIEPPSRTTYTLTATGEGGPITRSVTINVRPEQLMLLGVDSGDGELTLRWEAFGSDANRQATSRSNTGLPSAQVQVQILAPGESWSDDDDFATGAVYRATVTEHTFPGLDNGTTYVLRGRRLFDVPDGLPAPGAIAGAWSAPREGTPEGATAPGPVRNLTVVQRVSRQLDLAWNPPSPPSQVTGYRIQHGISDKNGNTNWPPASEFWPWNGQSFVIPRSENLQVGQFYGVRVQACADPNQCGDWSSVITSERLFQCSAQTPIIGWPDGWKVYSDTTWCWDLHKIVRLALNGRSEGAYEYELRLGEHEAFIAMYEVKVITADDDLMDTHEGGIGTVYHIDHTTFTTERTGIFTGDPTQEIICEMLLDLGSSGGLEAICSSLTPVLIQVPEYIHYRYDKAQYARGGLYYGSLVETGTDIGGNPFTRNVPQESQGARQSTLPPEPEGSVESPIIVPAKAGSIIVPARVVAQGNGFDVVLLGKVLVFVKAASCSEADIAASSEFVLRVRPNNVDDLAEDRRAIGFDDLSFIFADVGVQRGDICYAVNMLPAYQISAIETGQVDVSTEEMMWSGSFAIISPVFRSAGYNFEVDELAESDAIIGGVAADDSDDEVIIYSIVSGNVESAFDINKMSGEISVAGTLDYDATSEYVLTVGAKDRSGGVSEVTVTITVIAAPTDYDVDDDGLIEVADLAQLNAIRWDLDGDGTSAEAGYALAFPDAPAAMGCPASGCTGYALTADLDFDTDGSGTVDANDAYWNNGAGWEPIGSEASPFTAVFDGNGHTIANLFIDRSGTNEVGLFGRTRWPGTIRRVGLPGVDVTGGYDTGSLVGWNSGRVEASYAGGRVASARAEVGGLVGWNERDVAASYAAVDVTGGDYAGGLVGGNHGAVTASYATGAVTGGAKTGGLAGWSDGRITASYATGRVTATSSEVGGLVGSSGGGTVTASYWDSETSGQSASAAGVGQTTSALQEPTGYGGIYAEWNVDVDGASGPDDPWHFGAPSEYPVLQVDFNGDGMATWQEFGEQRAVVANRPPVFAEGPTTTRAVPENTAAGEPIGLPVTARDPDASDVVTYALGGTDATSFDLVTATGQLQTELVLDYERQREYQVTITARDDHGGSTTITVTIQVEDVADTPTFQELSYEFPVREDAAVGAAVGTVTATPAGGGALTYAITPDTAAGPFAIDGSSGQLTVAGALEASSYALTVSATEAGGGTATVPVTITVAAIAVDYDRNDDGLIEVASLAQLHAIRWDLDGDGTAIDPGYALAFPEAPAGMGCPATGCTGYELTADLDFDTDGSGTVDAADAYWNGGLGWAPIGSSAEPFAVVFDGNGHTIANLFIDRRRSDIGLFGSTDTASVIRHVSLTDLDIAGDSSVGGLVGFGQGTIHASYVRGQVTGSGSAVGGLAGWSFGDISTSYADVVVVGDYYVGGLLGAATATVTASYARGSVAAGASGEVGGLVGWNLGTIEASYARGAVTGGGDLGGGLVGSNLGAATASYWDTTSSGQSASAAGVGQTTGALQEPTGYGGIYAEWNVDSDGASGPDDPWHFGTPSEYPVLQVDFNGDGVATWQEFGEQRPVVANRPPVFAEGPTTTRAVPENTAAGEPIGLPVTARDPDASDVVTYALGGRDAATFDLVAATGQLQTELALDYERQREYEVTITASDDRGGSTTIAVTIQVEDVADTPVFAEPSYEFPVREDAAVGAAVGTVTATPAGGGALTYLITAGNTGDAFAVDPATGALTVAAPLDYLTTASYTLTVSASVATGTADVTVTMTVTGVDCANGTVIDDPRSHAALVGDCRVLLAAVEVLEGDAGLEIEGGGTLDWSDLRALAQWEGVATGGTPRRVTGLELADKSLGGEIPSGLGRLTVLTTLDLSANRLTGAVPAELSGLTALTTLRLSGNRVGGCLPTELRALAAAIEARGGAQDLAQLALAYCDATAPAAPTDLAAAATTATSITLSWVGATDAGTLIYRVEHRVADSDDAWTAVVRDEPTAASQVVDGLTCGTGYAFRVSAVGDGVGALAIQGPWSTVHTAATSGCGPVFDAASYAFPIGAGAALGTPVGTVSATPAGGGVLTYAITAGNEAGGFAMGATTGDLTVAGALEASSYALTVSATEAGGGTATVPVTISVAPPPAVTVAFGQATYTATEGAVAGVTVTVTLSADPQRDLTIPLTVTPQGGAEAADHTGVPTSVRFAAGATATSFVVVAVDDALDDDGESLVLGFGALPAQVMPGTPATTTLSLADNDEAAPLAVTVAFGQATYTATEGADEGVTVTVTLSADPQRDLTIPLTVTAQGGAEAADHTGVPTSVSFAAGATATSFVVVAVDDALDDDGESLVLGFGALPAQVMPGTPATTTLSLADDDEAPPLAVTVAFGQATYTATEGADEGVTVTVTLSADPQRDLTIPLTVTAQGGAEAADHTGVPTSVSFAAGATATSFVVVAVDDALDDDGEAIQLGFGALPAQVMPGTPATTTLSLADDDEAPPLAVTVAFGQATYTATEGADEGVTVTVTLSADPQRDVTIPLTVTAQGGAEAADHTGVPTSVSFAAGATATSFVVVAVDDALDDDGESLVLGFGALPARVTPGTPATTTLSLADDDEAPPLAVTVAFGQATYTATEGADEGVTVTVTLSADPQRDLTIPLTVTAQGGAEAADHTGVPTSVSFAAGATATSFVVVAVDDALDDDGEAIQLGFGALPARVTPGTPATTTLSLADDDATAEPTDPAIWSATLTVATFDYIYLGYRDVGDGPDGALTDADFEWRGVTYTVVAIIYSPHTGLDVILEASRSGSLTELTLHVDDVALPVADAEVYGGPLLLWGAVRLDWTAGDRVTVTLTAPAGTGS